MTDVHEDPPGDVTEVPYRCRGCDERVEFVKPLDPANGPGWWVHVTGAFAVDGHEADPAPGRRPSSSTVPPLTTDTPVRRFVGGRRAQHYLVTHKGDDGQPVEKRFDHLAVADAVAHFRAPALVMAVTYSISPETGRRVETQEVVKEY